MNVTLQTVLYNPLSWDGDVEFWLIKGPSFHKQAQKHHTCDYTAQLPALTNPFISVMYEVNMGLIFHLKKRHFWIEIICTALCQKTRLFFESPRSKDTQDSAVPSYMRSRGYCWHPPVNQFNFQDSISIDETGLALTLAFSREQMSWLPMRMLPLLTLSECTRAALTLFRGTAAANLKEKPRLLRAI